MSWLGGLIGGVASLIGGKQRNRAQQQMAREQMQFQERMSNTAHQRAAKDLEAAGLNRILALGKPGSSPAGAQAAIQDEITPGISTALQTRRLKQELKNMGKEADRTHADTNVKISTLGLLNAQKAKTLYEANSAETVSKILKRDLQVADIDKALYDKAPIVRILEKVWGTGAVRPLSTGGK